jgi:predicted NBD/HSP70 family sugar kinase
MTADGDAHGQATMDHLMDYFGRALSNVVNILDPDVIVLGGGVSNIDQLYTAGRQAVERYTFNGELHTPIIKASLGDSAGVFGAALL